VYYPGRLVPFENAIYQWDEGRRRLREAPTVRRPALERVTDQIVAELRRRLGGQFTTGELADLHAQGPDGGLALAVATAPEDPHAWDSGTVADAAFSRYVREASDFAGGRRTDE
jgi:hypothetical protein